jgi:hypothetical protein
VIMEITERCPRPECVGRVVVEMTFVPERPARYLAPESGWAVIGTDARCSDGHYLTSLEIEAVRNNAAGRNPEMEEANDVR